MKVTLNQAEIFAAIGHYLSARLNLSPGAQLEIDLTAGRVAGYTADVEIEDPTPMSVRCRPNTAVPPAEVEVFPEAEPAATSTQADLFED